MNVVGGLVATLSIVALVTACGNGRGDAADTWNIEGTLQAQEAGVWIVDTVPIVVPAGVTPNGAPSLGAIVVASGEFDDAGRRVARNVSLRTGAEPASTLPEVSLSGAIEYISDRMWFVGGHHVVVPASSQIRSIDPAVDATHLIQTGTVADISGNTMNNERVIAREIVLHPSTNARPPDPVEPAATDVQPPEQDPPAQPAPDPPAHDDAEGEDGDDGHDESGEGNDTDDDNDRKDKDKPEKPDRDDKPGNGYGRDRNEKP